MDKRAALIMAAVLVLAPVGYLRADEPSLFSDPRVNHELQRAQELARRAATHLMESLHRLEQSVPRFGLPYIDEAGNIVIPRRPAPQKPAPDPDFERT
jgi:hypothetical protein